MAQRVTPIVSDPDVMDGEPRLEGRRISVRQIVELVEDAGIDASTVADRYDLDLADVYAALSYYHSHPDVMTSVQRRIDEHERVARDRGAVSLEELREDEKTPNEVSDSV